MDNDTTSKHPGAKLENTQPISERFNLSNELAEQIEKASPKAQAKVEMLLELKDERHDSEKKSQQRSHEFRKNKAKISLLEKYIRDPAPRPNDQHSKENDLAVIDSQAEKMVKDREAFWQTTISREANASIRQVLAKDQQGQSADHSQHDHEQEH